MERKSLKTLIAIPLSYNEPGHDAVQPYHQHPNVHRTKIRGDLLRYYVLPCPGHSSFRLDAPSRFINLYVNCLHLLLSVVRIVQVNILHTKSNVAVHAAILLIVVSVE